MRVLAAVMTAACLALAAGSPARAEGDPQAGRQKAETCLGCHGIAGYTNVYPTYHVPKIAGQHEAYLLAALQAYASGQRSHATMQAQAASLSEQDMADIAAYFASLGTPAAVAAEQAPAGAPEKAATCASCHGPTGVSQIPANPVIAGQYRDYLVQSLKAYRDGGRDNAVMKSFAGQLSEQEIEALAAFYARQRGPLEVAPREGTPF